ncbi:MAG: hypothetical protein FWG03_01355 [Clostridiales bacterium]|nr:hypothetical protein [Clostridiales bacterium]
MGTGNAELKYKRRKADAYTAPKGRRGSVRPAFQPYEPPVRKERKERRVKPPPRNEADYHPMQPLKTLTPSEMRAIFIVVLIVSAVAMGIILLAAEAAVTQKAINDLKKGIAQVDDDIANLKIEIEQAQNMQLLKLRAQNELGMKEPTFDQYVYISELPEPMSDFGRYIKERAYGGARSQAADPDPEADPEADE